MVNDIPRLIKIVYGRDDSEFIYNKFIDDLSEYFISADDVISFVDNFLKLSLPSAKLSNTDIFDLLDLLKTILNVCKSKDLLFTDKISIFIHILLVTKTLNELEVKKEMKQLVIDNIAVNGVYPNEEGS